MQNFHIHIIGIIIIICFPVAVGLIFGISYILSGILRREIKRYEFYIYFFSLLFFFLVIFSISLYTSTIGTIFSYSPFLLIILPGAILIGVGLYYFEIFASFLYEKITHFVPSLKTRVFVGKLDKTVPKIKNHKFSILIMLSIGISFMEEFIWRGFLISVLKNDFSLALWQILLLSSFVFGINHYYFGLKAIILKFGSGVILGLLFLYTSNIFIPFATHTSFNIYLWWRKKVIDEKIFKDSLQEYSST